MKLLWPYREETGVEEGKEKERLIKLRDTGDDNEMMVEVRREEKKKLSRSA